MAKTKPAESEVSPRLIYFVFSMVHDDVQKIAPLLVLALIHTIPLLAKE